MAAEVTQEQFIDATVFTVALNVFQVLKPEDPFVAEGVLLFKRFRPALYEGVGNFFGPLMAEPAYARANSAYRLMVNNRNGQPELYRKGIEAVLDVLNSRPADVRETFSSSALGVRAVMQLARALESDVGSEILMEIAKIPAVSRARVMRNWIKEACERAGVSPSEVEETLVDASEGRHLGAQLQRVDDQIAASGLMTEDGVDLKAEKAEIVKAIEQVARQSPSPEVVIAAVATAQTTNTAQAPKTSQGLSPDQQAAVESTGKVLFAAGAGSGKTRVLAKKVVYHLEQGLPASSIVATSFSRKSAAELMKRVKDYGGEIPKGMDGGFGTTHSVAAKLLRDYGGGNALDSMSTYLAKDLIRLAMEQVKMSAAPPGDPEVVSLIPQLQALPTNDGSSAPLSFLQALEAASKKKLVPYYQSFINSFFDPNNQWYAQTMRATRNFTDPRGLSGPQRDILKKIFDIAGVSYSPTTDPVLNGSQKRASDVQDAPVANIRMIHVAAGNQADTEGYKAKYPTSFTTPARQWFNIGDDLTESGGKGEKKPIPPAVFKNAITKYKGQLISPTEAWAKDKSPMAAVYGAYEWLRGPQGDPAFLGKGDFDDLLVSAVRMMVKSPDALKRIQKQFRVLLIDEAQDLNKTQHVLFGLMAGVVDPSKAHKAGSAKKIKEVFWDDSRMSADVYALIGDDFQSIYGFRSADPKQFVDLSDLVQGGAGFKTHLLTTNYRSGKEIVDLGMRLISHNDDQVPKVCEANPNRSSKGEVSVVKFAPVEGGRMTEVASWVADKIVEDKEIGDFGHKGYDSYGVAVRSNAEAYLYGLEMLKRGIPFRSKANFFKNKTTQAVLAWLTIADEGVGGSEKRINEAVLMAKEFPSSKLGPKFVENLQQMATGNYIDWLGQNWKQVFGSRGAWAEKVLDFVGNLKAVRAMSGQSSQLVFESILDLLGADGKSLKETLVDRVKDDDEMLAELRSNSEDGAIDEHALMEAALAPIMPVMSIIEARADLKESMNYVRQLQAANDKLAAEDDPDGKGYNEPAVTINTIHGWKGLEVERMFVPFVGGSFPRLDATKEDLAEERRIGYTALTRAEERLYVLNVPKVFGGEKKRTVVESQFIGEMCLGRSPPPKEIVDQDVQDALGMSMDDVDLDGVEDLL